MTFSLKTHIFLKTPCAIVHKGVTVEELVVPGATLQLKFERPSKLSLFYPRNPRLEKNCDLLPIHHSKIELRFFLEFFCFFWFGGCFPRIYYGFVQGR